MDTGTGRGEARRQAGHQVDLAGVTRHVTSGRVTNSLTYSQLSPNRSSYFPLPPGRPGRRHTARDIRSGHKLFNSEPTVSKSFITFPTVTRANCLQTVHHISHYHQVDLAGVTRHVASGRVTNTLTQSQLSPNRSSHFPLPPGRPGRRHTAHDIRSGHKLLNLELTVSKPFITFPTTTRRIEFPKAETSPRMEAHRSRDSITRSSNRPDKRQKSVIYKRVL
ncbi:hypothetical protein J6590_014278 [Homalodisca vitripennis]|nr:hypothetical protein J6590_014278 [Homalodisca vitripennis]